jgi:hypothetical protein
MKPFVDIEGSGELTTKITSASFTLYTMTGASSAELRFLTLESLTGRNVYTYLAEDLRLTHVTVTSVAPSGSSNLGVWCVTSTLTLTDVDIHLSEGSFQKGINARDCSMTVENSSISANTGIALANVLEGPFTVNVINSQINNAATNTIYNVGATTHTAVMASRLSGAAVRDTPGTLTCAGVYDENYIFYANTCP